MSRRKKIPLRLLQSSAWALLLPAVSSFVLTAWAVHVEDWIKGWDLIVWVFFYILITVAMSVAILPTTLIALFSGFFLGFQGLFPMILSYTIASLLGYRLAQLFERGETLGLIHQNQRLVKFIARFEQKQYEFAFWLRLTPLLTFALTNILVATLNMRLKPFLIGGTLGMLPRVIFVIWIGSEVQNWQLILTGESQMSDLNFYTFWVLAAISLLGLMRLLFFHKKE
ncbi:MAG: TVP38/TMEM64 family protein [Bernardetiaceae bacterium]|nr:TVP38/TMEM64 family protein [Bernardetiaceae bacterium]